MKQEDLEKLRGRNVTIGKFTFLFTRKPVKTGADVNEREMQIARIAIETEPLKQALDLAKNLQNALHDDVTSYFKLSAAKEIRDARGDGPAEQQLRLFEIGDIIETPVTSRAPRPEAAESAAQAELPPVYRRTSRRPIGAEGVRGPSGRARPRGAAKHRDPPPLLRRRARPEVVHA